MILNNSQRTISVCRASYVKDNNSFLCYFFPFTNLYYLYVNQCYFRGCSITCAECNFFLDFRYNKSLNAKYKRVFFCFSLSSAQLSASFM